MSTGTPVLLVCSLSTGMRALSTSVCFLTHGALLRSSESSLSAPPTPAAGTAMSSSTTSMSEEERASPVERDP